RHTRSKRDWSSDVCSSDLAARDDLAERGNADLVRPDLVPEGELALTVDLELDEFAVVDECAFGIDPTAAGADAPIFHLRGHLGQRREEDVLLEFAGPSGVREGQHPTELTLPGLVPPSA